MTLAALSSLAAIPASAQITCTARIAWSSISRADPDSPFLQGFLSRLAELGWVEGRNLALDAWWADAPAARLKELIPQIVASRPDVIVATGGPTVRYFVAANVKIPVAFTNSADVVVAGIVNSWSRPGVNRTGVSFFSLELVPKRLALMKEMMPSMKRVAIVGWPPHAGELLELEAARTSATKLGLLHQYYGANTVAELDAAFEAIALWKADAILAFAGTVAALHADRFAAFAIRNRIPTVSAWADFAERGNLMTYGPVLRESFVSLAGIVDRILKGANAADIPVEQPTKLEFVINMKTAKALGLAIPQSILVRADRMIE
ncbi:MAG: ABC transporter substrate-binding protein [Betaproteobacteria bacterium]